MGSSSSKRNAADSSPPSSLPSSSSVNRTRSYRSRVFQSSCLGSHHESGDAVAQVSGYHIKEDEVRGPCTNETKSVSNDRNDDHCRKVKVQQSDDISSETSEETEDDEWGQSRGGCMSSRVFSSRALNSSTHFLSRLNCFPGNVSFRLRRANSLGSARPYFESFTRSGMTSNEGERSPPDSMDNGNLWEQGHDLFHTFFTNQPHRVQHEGIDTDHIRRMNSVRGLVGDQVDIGVDFDGNSGSRNGYTDGTEARLANRRIAAGEIVEQNVQFSRTLSVGRLRDRVLRRSSFADVASSPFQQQREARHANRLSERQVPDGGMGFMSSEMNTSRSSASSTQSGPGSTLYGNQYYEQDTSRPREARYHDLFEYRSNFLERRRRIRSQVRALQRLGSRFENIAGHERTCVLSGQHRRGRCLCRLNTQNADSSDETSARASISRIVMLAEALFEVLDEIHQQSVVLSSRRSIYSMGSTPAPNEVVESLPLRSYSKLQKPIHDEAAQCYICLVEYEEGDSLRKLPCHHEYHKMCIDKWLKDIHRVCPLCRGDVCQPDSLTMHV